MKSSRTRSRTSAVNCSTLPLDSLIADDVRVPAREFVNRFRQHVHAGAARDVVEDDRQTRRFGDRAEMREHAVLRRLAVVRHDREDAVDAGLASASFVSSTEWRVLLPVVPAMTVAVLAELLLDRGEERELLIGLERRRFAGRAADDRRRRCRDRRETARCARLRRRRRRPFASNGVIIAVKSRPSAFIRRPPLAARARRSRAAPVRLCPAASSGTSTEIVMFESVEWMISTSASRHGAHDAGHDARRAAHAGADDRELRAMHPHAQREVEVVQFGAHAFDVLVVAHEEHAGVVDVDHVDRDVLRGEPIEQLAIERRAAALIAETLDDAEERDVAQRRDAGDRAVAIDRRIVVDQRADVAAQALDRIRRLGGVREFGGLGMHDFRAVAGEFDHLGRRHAIDRMRVGDAARIGGEHAADVGVDVDRRRLERFAERDRGEVAAAAAERRDAAAARGALEAGDDRHDALRRSPRATALGSTSRICASPNVSSVMMPAWPPVIACAGLPSDVSSSANTDAEIISPTASSKSRFGPPRTGPIRPSSVSVAYGSG